MTSTAPAPRPAAPFVPFRTPVRGHVFAARPPQTPPPVPGQHVDLCREPHNPADPLAVAVWLSTDGSAWRIGYLAREVAARIAPRLDRGAGLEARIDGWVTEPAQRWQRPVLAVFPVPTPDPPATRDQVPEPRPATSAPRHAPAASEAPPSRPARSVRRRVPAGRGG